MKTLDVVVNSATIIDFHHRKLMARHLVSETVKCSNDVAMSLKIDPIFDVFFIRDLSDDELLSEFFMINDESRI